jgi:hypothetical protein
LLEKLKRKQEIQMKELSTNDWMLVSKFLQRKLIQVLSFIASAADMTNGWILCHGAPSSNEKMLEIAIDRTAGPGLQFWLSTILQSLKDSALVWISPLMLMLEPLTP